MSDAAIKKRKTDSMPEKELQPMFAGIDFATATASEIADYIVSMVPVMEDDKTSDKVAKALDIAQQKILVRDYREHAKRNEVASDLDVGSVSFCNVVVPKEAVHHILEYIPQYDLCKRVGHSCKALLVATRVPSLWSRLNVSTTIVYWRFRKEGWWKIFTKPQFASLMSLPQAPPLSQDERCKMPMSLPALELLSRACPQLEELNLERAEQMLLMHEAAEFSSLFPNLTSLTICNCEHISTSHIEKICQGLGRKLLKLTVVMGDNIDVDSDGEFCIKTLASIVQSCPNLQEF
ncbi:MAG: hypothetical protein SGARI_007784, partial [Bacillariaceae sp.]